MIDDLVQIIQWAWAIYIWTERGGKDSRVKCSWQCTGGELQYNWWFEVETEPLTFKKEEPEGGES